MEGSKKKNIKIVRVISRLNVGGPAIHTVLLSQALNNDGYVDLLICGKISDSEGDMGYFAREKGVGCIVIPELKRDISIKDDAKAFIKLLAIIRRERPDIVHTHAAKAGALGRLAAIISGVPVRIHTFHGHIFDGYFSPFKAKVFLLIERIMALFTSTIVTVSGAVRDEIVNKLRLTDGKRCVVIPLGLELDKFLRGDADGKPIRKELGADDGTVLVGIVGRLVPIKNHDMFLDSAKSFLKKNPGADIKFAVVGDGEMRDYLERRVAELGIGGYVIFAGWRKDLAAVYAGLDIVALTSLNEGTPVSIIEAMASGRPVVATEVGGVGDLITHGHDGFLVKSNDVEGFSDRLSELISSKEMRSEFGRSGRERVRYKYSKERLVKDMEALYEECIDKARSK
jgi:glycosyltransferase involved in cell wall biosynthesis